MPWREAPAKAVSPHAARNAQVLRRRSTESEKRLWWHLRHRLPIAGSHFRRQVPIDSYVADVCCLQARLIVEVDGGGHSGDAQAAHDAKRTRALEAQGFRVLRFTDTEVMRSIDCVLDTIAAALGTASTNGAMSGTTPTPDPSPQGGGEQAEP